MSKFKVGDMVCRHELYSGGDWEFNARRNGVPVQAPREVERVEDGAIYIGEEAWADDLFDLVPAANTPTVTPAAAAVSDSVNSPKHYQFFPDLEAIEVIARSMTQEQFYGYCLGNRLKYRLRAGNKGKLEQDIAKSDKYSELYEQHRGKCIDAK